MAHNNDVRVTTAPINKKLFLDMGMPDEVAADFKNDKNQPTRPHIRLERAEMAASRGDTASAEAEFAHLLKFHATLCSHHVQMTDGVFDWTHFKQFLEQHVP